MRTLDLNKYKRPGAAAKALAAHLRLEVYGDENNNEVVLLTPDRSEELGYGKVWRVMWEGGPFEWMSDLSLADFGCNGNPSYGVKYDPMDPKLTWHMEPYYSFDVGFYLNR